MSEVPTGDTFDMSGDFRQATIYIKSAVPGGPAIRIPFQRPPRAEHFTDREPELAQLLTDLQPGRVVTLCGPGGIGKTALAAEVVWALAPGDEPPERFPDGVVFHSFYNQPQAAVALEAIARAFGEDPRPTPRDAAQRALAGKQALLLLDGTEAADDLGAVLGVRDNCGVLVTSRTTEDAVADWQDLPPLSTAEAVELLQAWGGERAADETAAQQICELVGGLPLAVRLVGFYLTHRKQQAATYLVWFQTSPLQALDQGDRQAQSVPLLLERSLDQVTEAACETLAVVGLLALAPFDGAVVATALNMPPFQAEHLLGELVSYGLLLRPADRYEVSHALIHTYARERLVAPEEAAGRLAAYYTQLAKTESEKGLVLSEAEGLEGYRRLDAERGHLMRVLAGCVEGERWEAARSLVWAVDGYLDIQGHWTERQTALEAGVTAARQLGDRRDEGGFLGNLGNAYSDLGQVERAIEYYEQCLTIHREIGDRPGEGADLGNLGLAYQALGQVEWAIEYSEQALEMAREIGDRRGESAHLGNLGDAYRELGQVERAIEYSEQALEMAREIGDRRGEGSRLGNLGSAYYLLGQVERAIEYSEQALEMAREIGDRRGEGSRLGNLGIAYSVLGQVERAIEYFEEALEIAREIGDRRNEGVWLGNLGLAYRGLGQVERAIEYHEEALKIAREIGNRRGQGNQLGNLGSAYFALKEYQRAGEYYQKQYAIVQEIGDRLGEGNALWGLAICFEAAGDRPQAVSHAQAALELFVAIKSPNAQAMRDLLTKWRGES